MIEPAGKEKIFRTTDSVFEVWDGFTKKVVEYVNVWINVYDKDLNLILWNETAQRISGYTSEEVLGHGKLWNWLYPDDEYLRWVIDAASTVLSEPSFLENFETEIVCKDGSKKNIMWNSSSWFDDEGNYLGTITFGYDLTETKISEAALRSAHKDLTVLYNIASIGSEGLDLDQILNSSLKLVLPAVNVSKGMIHLWDDTSQILRLAASEGLTKEAVSGLQTIDIGDDPVRQVLLREHPVYLPSILNDKENLNSPIRNLFHAYIGVPMRAKGAVVGVISLLGKAGQTFTKYDISLLTSIADQIGVSVVNNRLNQQARHLAVSEERRRLARELHDAVTQSLYGLTLFAEAGQRALRDGDLNDVGESLAELGTTAQSALKEMRLLLHELRPMELETENFIDVIRHRLDAVERKVGVKSHLDVEKDLQLPSRVEQELYRIIQEALNNSLRHSGAKTVNLSIHNVDGILKVVIMDDGVGFDTFAMKRKGRTGFESMFERAESLGAILDITSEIGHGVIINLTLNLETIPTNWEV